MSRLGTALAAIALSGALVACGTASAPAPADNVAANDVVDNAANMTMGETPTVIAASYDCKPAMKVDVVYDNSDPETSRAKVTIDGKTYDMTIARSASGARYATDAGRSPGKTLVWWNKGNDGTLLEGKAGAADATEETIVASCTGKG